MSKIVINIVEVLFMEDNKYGFYIVGIIAVVAIVSLVVLTMGRTISSNNSAIQKEQSSAFTSNDQALQNTIVAADSNSTNTTNDGKSDAVGMASMYSCKGDCTADTTYRCVFKIPRETLVLEGYDTSGRPIYGCDKFPNDDEKPVYHLLRAGCNCEGTMSCNAKPTDAIIPPCGTMSGTTPCGNHYDSIGVEQDKWTGVSRDGCYLPSRSGTS